MVGITASAEEWEVPGSATGRLIRTQFFSAPFPHPSRTNGHVYREVHYPADRHYADATVALFVPAGFRAMPGVDLVIHFHGWRNSVAGALSQFELAEQLEASRRNAILIVPQGPRDAPDSAGGKLEDPGGFERFLAEAQAVLRQHQVIASNAVVGRVILSGHSGGYRVMSAIVAGGGREEVIREVWLFDGLYAQRDRFLGWAEPPGRRLLNIYTDDGGTKTRSEEMRQTLCDQGKSFLATTDGTVTRQELQTNRVVLLHTDLAHNDVLARRRTFQLFLETSCLTERPRQ
jgi:hypothetical protein